MPLLSIVKNYSDGTELEAQELTDAFDSIEEFVNDIKLDSDNIQPSSVDTAELADSSVTTAKIDTAAITLAKLAQEIIERLHVPGDVKTSASVTVDPGWLYCDGSAVSRTTYAALFAKIGEAHGQGDNATTFNIPDYRGWFLRGQDDGQAVDPNAGSRTAPATGGNAGDLIGSAQTSTFTSHSHAVTDPLHAHLYDRADGATQAAAGAGSAGFSQTVPASATVAAATGISINSSGGSETRPVNKNVRFFIKY